MIEFVSPISGNKLERIKRKEDKVEVDLYFDSDTKHEFYFVNGVPDFTYPLDLAEIDEAFRETYNKLADEYDKFANIPFETFKTTEHEVRVKITNELNLSNDLNVLEIGAGDGRGAEYIASALGKNAVFHVQELSPAFLRKAMERLRKFEKSTSIVYSIASAMYLPFSDNSFDRLHHFGGFNTFSDQKRCFDEMVRVVKPGGRIVIGDEGMAPWLRQTEMGKIMMNSNPLLEYEIPFDKIPVVARNVKIEWIMMGAFFLLSFDVSDSEPVANYHIPIPSSRGGTHWTRYYGQLEGVSDDVKRIAYEMQKKSGKDMTSWLEEIIIKRNNNEF